MKKKAIPKNSPKSHINNTSKVAQRRRVADYLLRHGIATTLDLQANCNALHSPRRVFELRHVFGWEIVTHWQRAHDQQGRPHRVGNYVLLKAGVMPS